MEKSALVYIFLTVVTVLFAFCVDNRDYVAVRIRGGREPGPYYGLQRRQARNLVAEAAVFCLLTGVSACRIAVGNDYWPYRFNFRLIAQERHVSSELGFNLIVRGMQDLFGYDNYLPIFALFSFLTVLFFVLALHDQGKHYAFSLFLLMTGGYYFNSLNTVRYYLALAVALYSMKYVLRGEYGKFLLWVFAGAAFHKSVFLVVPVYLAARGLAFVRLKGWHIWAGGALTLSLIFGQDIYRKIIFFFYPGYEGSAFDNGQIPYMNLLKCGAVLVLCGFCYRRSLWGQGTGEKGQSGGTLSAGGSWERLANRFYFFLNGAGFLVCCCGSFIPEVSRVAYYMMASQVFLLPGILSEMEEGWFKKLCYAGVIGAFTLYFVFLLHGMYAVDVRLLPYRNWIFQ